MPYNHIATRWVQYHESDGKTRFEWDTAKVGFNQQKHGIPFSIAQHAFADPKRVILFDEAHSGKEQRFYCLGRVGEGILTVRFTYRNSRNQEVSETKHCRLSILKFLSS